MTTFGFVERLKTVAATATVTSAVWILVGTVYLDPNGSSDADMLDRPTNAGSSSNLALADAGELAIPVLGVAADELTDTFSDARGGRRHEAIDIMAPAGTPVVAAAPGTVEKLFFSDDGGNTIYLRSTDRRTIHYYAHLEGYAPGLAEGQQVRRGQRLGTVGSSGNADPAAPHLHFAVMRTTPEALWWESAGAINPYPMLKPGLP
jgi:murein DD-endopeptidase MepM/ murein hydrolase activator NlpD